eukprot:1178331-Prorocentrum_minimum.AAC.3
MQCATRAWCRGRSGPGGGALEFEGAGRWIGLNTDTVQLTVKILLSHLITLELDSPTNSLRTPYISVLSPSAGAEEAWRSHLAQPLVAQARRRSG